MISILLPILNEEKYIRVCLDSILLSDYPHNEMELFVIDGMSTDNTRRIVSEYSKRYSFIHLLDNIHKTVPYAMNLGIKHAKGEYIIRLDAHSKYPKDYFTKLVMWSKRLKADNIGGVWQTEVLNKNPTSIAIKKVLSSKFGVGNAHFRTGVQTVLEADTVPFGCYRQEVFKTYGLYDERLTRNQDIELNKRIKHGGGKIYLVPDIHCTYYARETYSALAKNNYANGLWNILTTYYTKNIDALSIRHFIPLLFILSLTLPMVLSLFDYRLIWITVASSLSHFTLITLVSWRLKDNGTDLLEIIKAFYTLHFSYGLGSLSGLAIVLLRILKGKE